MNRLKPFASIGTFLAVGVAVLTATTIIVALGVGYVLNLCVPTIDFDSATLIGVIAFGVVVVSTAAILVSVVTHNYGFRYVADSEDEDEDYDDELFTDEQVDTVADRIADAIVGQIQKREPQRVRSAKRFQK